MSGAGSHGEVGGTGDRPLILFVCSGNICRSPFAEAAARARLEAAGYEVASAGTLMTEGNPSTADARAVAHEVGLDLTGHRSRPATRELLAGADRIFAMDRSHVARLSQQGFRAELLDPDGGEIPDPYGRGVEAYRTSYRMIAAVLDRRFGNP